MYVTTVHGRMNVSAGTNANALVISGRASCRKKTTMLAAMSRLTHGVTNIPPE